MLYNNLTNQVTYWQSSKACQMKSGIFFVQSQLMTGDTNSIVCYWQICPIAQQSPRICRGGFQVSCSAIWAHLPVSRPLEQAIKKTDLSLALRSGQINISTIFTVSTFAKIRETGHETPT